MNADECYLKEESTATMISERLKAYSYRIWSKNTIYIQTFVSDGNFEDVINILRPKSLESIPTGLKTIDIWLYQDKEPLEICDSWPAVLHGLAAKIISDTLKAMPSIIDDVLNSYPWLPDRLTALCHSSSIVETYGAFVCLETVYWSGSVRQGANLGYLSKRIQKMVEMACETRKGLLSAMRWRLAFWRAAFEMFQTLSAISGLDLHSSDKPSLIPLRADWREFSDDGYLLIALLRIFKFVVAAIPKPAEEKFATVFSGPGIFKDSGMSLQDLSHILRSTCFMVKRLCVNDVLSKSCLMKQSEMVGILKQLGGLFDESTKHDILDLLFLMGVNNPASNFDTISVVNGLRSQDPKMIFKALKLLAHSHHLIDAENWAVLHDRFHITAGLFRIIMSDINTQAMSEKVGKLKIQLDPMRDVLVVPPQTLWKAVVRSFATFVLGKQALSLDIQTIGPLSKELYLLCDIVLNQFKNTNLSELEKWGLSQFLAGAFKSSPLMIIPIHDEIVKKSNIVAFKLLSCEASSESASCNFQLKYQTWLNAVCIMDGVLESKMKESKEEYLSELRQMGIIPCLFDILKDIAEAHHHEVDISTDKTEPYENALAKPKEVDDVDIEFKYSADDTLPSLLYHIFNYINRLALNDKFTREILLWEGNLFVMEIYLYFCSGSVHAMITKIFNELITDLKQTPIRKLSHQQTVSRRISLRALQEAMKQVNFANRIWPQHLKQPDVAVECETMQTSGISVLDRMDGALIEYWRVNEDWIFEKICSNPTCTNRESRTGQFKQYPKSPGYFCSKGCKIKNTQK